VAGSLATVAGIYMGLVGIFYAVTNKNLDDPMLGAPSHPKIATVTVRTYIVDLLAYGAATAAMGAVGLPYVSGLAGLAGGNDGVLRLCAAVGLAAITLHHMLLLLLGLRFMQKHLPSG
jgi:hypothetical protein